MLGVQQAVICSHARPLRREDGRHVNAVAVARTQGPTRVLTARAHLQGTDHFASIARRSAMCTPSRWQASRERVLTVRCVEKRWEAKFDSSPYDILSECIDLLRYRCFSFIAMYPLCTALATHLQMCNIPNGDCLRVSHSTVGLLVKWTSYVFFSAKEVRVRRCDHHRLYYAIGL